MFWNGWFGRILLLVLEHEGRCFRIEYVGPHGSCIYRPPVTSM